MRRKLDGSFICPVCGEELWEKEGSLLCENRHCFDIARKGYVNLLRSNKTGHGDDKLMVNARRLFLNSGAYSPLLKGLCSLLVPLLPQESRVLDIGCGECWYTAGILSALDSAGKDCEMLGIDISREALAAGAGRDQRLSLAVASSAALPVSSESCDAVMNLFAPIDAAEASRVLKEDGVLLRAVVLEEHLMGLKKAVYEQPVPNPPPDPMLSGFCLIRREEIRSVLRLENNADIRNLFCMTPYYYKTGRRDQEKLLTMEQLETEIAFSLMLYTKDKTM